MLVWFQQQVDHESDHLARGKVVTRCLIGSFIETPDEVLKEETHGDVVYPPGVQVHLGKLGDDEIQAVGFLQLFDFLFEFEIVEDFADVFGKARNVINEMAADVVRISLELGKVKVAVVVEAYVVALAGSLIENGIDVFDLAVLDLLEAFDYCRFGRSQYAIEASQNGHREHHALVLRWSVWAAEQIGYGPDKIRKLLKTDGHQITLLISSKS
jgi:hypothetical protein